MLIFSSINYNTMLNKEHFYIFIVARDCVVKVSAGQSIYILYRTICKHVQKYTALYNSCLPKFLLSFNVDKFGNTFGRKYIHHQIATSEQYP